MHQNPILLLLISLLSVSCGNLSPEEQVKNFRELPTQKLNDSISRAYAVQEAWITSPKEIISHLLSNATGHCNNVDILVNTLGEEKAIITLTAVNCRDDSVMGLKYIAYLENQDNGFWLITRLYKGWRCSDGRGHSDYNSTPCI